jgi:hypothetical protein
MIEILQLVKSKNVALLPRDVIYPVAQAGIVSHNMQTTNLHSPAIGLDVSVYNTDTNDHYFYLDGIPIVVKAGQITSLSDTPFVNFFTDSNPSTWVVRILGISLEVLRRS